MGYAPDYFCAHVASWMRDGLLRKGGRLIDFGAQEFHGDPDAARARTGEFLASRGMSEAEVTAAVGRRGKPEVASVYRAIGIDYVAIDVDGSHGSTFFDLNTFAPPPEWIGAFDMVNNEGTIEHLVNPINGFQVAHELLKVGGKACSGGNGGAEGAERPAEARSRPRPVGAAAGSGWSPSSATFNPPTRVGAPNLGPTEAFPQRTR